MRILNYLKCTKEFGLVFVRPPNFDGSVKLEAMVDASFMSEDGHKSRLGYFFFMNGALISWASQNTTRLVTSSTEAECHGLIHVGKENIWQRELHQIFGLLRIDEPTTVFQDNKSAITLTQGIKVSNKRSKHFGLEFDCLREYVSLGEMKIVYRETNDLPADMLTKPLPGPKFVQYRNEIMGGPNLQKIFEMAPLEPP
jgi:hypothetical protein